MPRLFVAVDLPAETRARLAVLAGGVPGARWVPPEQLHITLRFIGEVDNGVFADVIDALADVHMPPFPVAVAGLGHFPPRGAPKVLWAGVADGAPLIRLHDKIERRLQALGLAPDGRKFTPHLTLARLKGAPLGRVRDFLAHNGGLAGAPFEVREFHLYSSRLGHEGAAHRIEASYPLE